MYTQLWWSRSQLNGIGICFFNNCIHELTSGFRSKDTDRVHSIERAIRRWFEKRFIKRKQFFYTVSQFEQRSEYE